MHGKKHGSWLLQLRFNASAASVWYGGCELSTISYLGFELVCVCFFCFFGRLSAGLLC